MVMTRSATLVALPLAAFVAIVVLLHDAEPDRVNEPLPALRFTRLDGTEFALTDLGAKPWIIALWLPGCSSCTKDMAALEEARQMYEARGVGFMALSVSEDPEVVKDAADELGVNSLIALSVGNVLGALRLDSVPSAVFVDRHGRIVGRVPYGSRSAGFFEKRAGELLAG